MVVMDTTYTIKKLPATLDLTANKPGAESELVFMIDLERTEEKGRQCGDGERVEKGVHSRDVVFEEGGHLVYGNAEEEKAIWVGLAAFEASDVKKPAYAGFTDAEDAVKAEATVADLGVEV